MWQALEISSIRNSSFHAASFKEDGICRIIDSIGVPLKFYLRADCIYALEDLKRLKYVVSAQLDDNK